MEGLAAMGVTNTYGDGKSNTIKHSYGGTINKSKKKKGK